MFDDDDDIMHRLNYRGSARSKRSGVPMDPRTNRKWKRKKYWGPNQGSKLVINNQSVHKMAIKVLGGDFG